MTGLPSADKVDLFAVNATDSPAGFDDELHGSAPSSRAAEDVAPRPIHQQAIQHALHARHLRGDVLPQPGVVTEVLRLHAADDPLGVGRRADRVARWSGRSTRGTAGRTRSSSRWRESLNTLRLAVLLARQPLRQMRDQLGQFGGKRLLGQPHRLVEPLLHPLALLLIELRVELLQIVRGFHATENPTTPRTCPAATPGSRRH